MLILALETATRAGSLAIVGPGRRHAMAGDTTRTHGARLPKELFDFLASQGLTLADVDRLAVVSGPGSFTGLRIGLATIQGIAMTSGALVIPVPTLDAMAAVWQDANRDRSCRLVTCLDGTRADVFFAVFDCGAPGGQARASVLEAAVETPAGAAAAVTALGGHLPLIAVGDGAIRYREVFARAWPTATFEESLPNLALGAALVASGRAGGDAAVAPHALKPLYVRRPDAVLARERARTAAAGAVLTVERATSPGDLAAIAELQRRSFANAWGAEAIQWEIDNSSVARMYAARGQDGTIVAYCSCWMIFDELHINSVAVDEAQRRKGIARRLLDRVLRDSAAAGARSATLEVRQSNEAGRRLYEGLGFKVEAVRRGYYQDPKEDALILWHRDLPARFARPER
ncbi:MAG TPA: tRNA (adenosine(37)-N6)-threonylcarbamoyltransferase complex dimerization subunit type 1 TsaB [Vicinamibacterales bacterium]|nr:tRNA (adenosine(37)-N6)-threonylcarbamoyltransferase complex dimerization subunit type 1 TsaB [Vicinamibacterales bacterium]